MDTRMPAKLPGEVTPANMEQALQQAIEIEIATIPIYLSTYYSLNRVPNQDAIWEFLAERLGETGFGGDHAGGELEERMRAVGFLQGAGFPDDPGEMAKELSAWIMVFANKAGALIMSVVMEEMLHMALSSNVKQALGWMPDLMYKSPGTWPAVLPGHVPPFDINRAAFSLDQLYTFMEIESPKPLGMLAADGSDPIPYTTIGEFYGLITQAIEDHYSGDDAYDLTRAQLVPGRGYYAQNNINTNFYTKHHHPRFVNAEDSGDLIRVVDMPSALQAIHEIVEQGEGNVDGSSFGPGDTVECDHLADPGDYDDLAREELAHFDKFNLLYCEYDVMRTAFQVLLDDPDFDVGTLFVYPFATNPVTADYPADIQATSNLLNATYAYTYLMTEACYRRQDDVQYEIFMFGIHKTMMWILGSLCETIRNSTYTGTDGATYRAAPTFENWRFHEGTKPKDQILALFETALDANPGLEHLGARIQSLPNVPIDPDEPILT